MCSILGQLAQRVGEAVDHSADFDHGQLGAPSATSTYPAGALSNLAIGGRETDAGGRSDAAAPGSPKGGTADDDELRRLESLGVRGALVASALHDGQILPDREGGDD